MRRPCNIARSPFAEFILKFCEGLRTGASGGGEGL